MSQGVNKAILIGNLGKDPELSHTQSGTAMTRFSLATSESYQDAEGERQERVEWHNIVVWGKQAETAAQYLQKGRRVYVEGKIQNRSYQDKEGIKRYITEINVQRFVFLGGREEGQVATGRAHTPQQSTSGYQHDPGPQGPSDDDIPF